MSLYAMPILIINMGGEMMYILEQRLKAQIISSDKSTRVLEEVASTMFNCQFMDELFKPQTVYTHQSVLQIFRRLAHSSIMRLNQNSMDKLYDLMIMGFKRQVLMCSRPSDVVQITMNHIDTLCEMFVNSDSQSNAYSLIERVRRITIKLYSTFSSFQFVQLRIALSRFFIDRRVKVSLFLEEHVQDHHGLLLASHKGAMPPGTHRPGFVWYLSDSTPIRQSCFELGNAIDVTEVPHDIGLLHDYCELGTNMYAVRRGAIEQDTEEGSTNNVIVPPTMDLASSRHLMAKRDLMVLANLVGVNSTSFEELQNVKLHVFSDDDSKLDSDALNSPEVLFDNVNTANTLLLESYAAELDTDVDTSDTTSTEECNDDLLSLMDHAMLE